ncbi:M28 family peptidase [Pseudenhygromyxa sp. WMMC2535]|uniref:M28 family peptidase n=1 Tax=Pseudenhygromyxa sp. WMMC2535 TaxID=2712867 RepID=UPI0015581EED|nr:M28 family peptidase [Pseudenhygromyxa sp. WMMC2535]NVB39039.1 M28 family peptidase [Pseudenhygromyxa sp. WMMC2535]
MGASDETWRGLPAMTLASLVLAVTLALLGVRPPAPLAADAAPERFSAGRALETMKGIFAPEGEAAPHPIGSSENAAARGRIVAALRALGLEPEVQERVVCNGSVCGWVANVIAVIPGAEEDPAAPAVMIAAHYDSVPAGPGIGDDGSGVGIVLESARALLAGPPPQSPVVLLIDDGEEVGLLGALAFVRHHPLAERVAVVVNTEARGARGPSRMFETKGESAWMLAAYLGEAGGLEPKPSSLSAAIYERMPNDTDLTIFGEAGMSGLNFAFIGGLEHYHRPSDDFEHLSVGSLQQQGDNVLAATRGLAAVDLGAAPPEGDAIYHPAFGVVPRMPGFLGLPLAALLMLGVVAATIFALRRERVRRRGLGLALVLPLAALVLAAGVDQLLGMLMQALSGSEIGIVLHPWPRWLAFVLGALAAGAGLVALVGERCTADQLRVASAAWASLLALLVAALLPGGVMVFGLLAAAAALPLLPVTWPRLATPGGRAALDLATALLVAWLVFDLALALAEAFGFTLAVALGAVLCLALLPTLGIFASCVARWPRLRAWTPAGALGLATLTAVIAGFMPVFSEDHALPLSLIAVYGEEGGEEGEAQLFAEVYGYMPPADELDAMALAHEPSPRRAWTWGSLLAGPRFAAEAPAGLRLEAVEVEATGTGRRVRGHLRSGRGCLWGQLAVPESAGLSAVKIADDWAEPRKLPGGLVGVNLRGMPAAGAELILEFEGAAPVELHTADSCLALPSGQETVARVRGARAAWIAPIQTGDREIVLESQPL